MYNLHSLFVHGILQALEFTSRQSTSHDGVTIVPRTGLFLSTVETNPFFPHEDGSLSAIVDLRVYGQEALLKTAHLFTGRCHLHLQTCDSDAVRVYFRAKDEKIDSLRDVVGDFFNELLDQKLRVLVQRESEPVRNLILAHALSRTSLLDHEEPSSALQSAAVIEPRQSAVDLTPPLPATAAVR